MEMVLYSEFCVKGTCQGTDIFKFVSWTTKDNFEFWPKIGQKWPKWSLHDRNWPESLKSDIRNHIHWISASLAVFLSGHMTSLRPS